MEKEPKQQDSLGKKIAFGAAYAGVIGVILWVVRDFIKDFRKNPSQATAKALLEPEVFEVAVLAAGGAAVGAYNYIHEKKERLEKKNHALEIENAVLKAKQSAPHHEKKSWVAAEQEKSETQAEAHASR